MCMKHIKPPNQNAQEKIASTYTGPTDTELADSMINCDPDVSDDVILSLVMASLSHPEHSGDDVILTE